jgi:hypothetical protein
MRNHTSSLLAVSRYLSAAMVGVLILTGAARASKSSHVRYLPDRSSLVNVGDFAATANEGRIEPGTIYAAIDKPTYATLGLNLVQQRNYWNATATTGGDITSIQSDIQSAISNPDPFTSAINDLVTQKRVINLSIYTAANVVAIASHTEFNPLVGDAAQIEVMSGPHKGEKLWVRRTDLVRMVEQTGKAKRKR